MLFHTLDFLYFFIAFFLVYWFVFQKSLKAQNILIFIASYIFYGWWDWRFLSLIAFSTVVDYAVGRKLSQTSSETHRKTLLWVSIAVNIGLLGFFKYFNFFAENLYELLSSIGFQPNRTSLDIILPVGISFYTFQTLSYTIDVYRRKIKPTRDFIAFGAFVSFFPQLVAGPIERASHLLPQFFSARRFNYRKAVDGSQQILWGLFKKVVIADKCGELADLIFNNSADLNGSSLILGTVFFSFQIYGDFSGYSDIAIGIARLLGFDLKQNFAFPYFSRDIAEFWRRWHISLSTWFRDYLYIPLGGSRGGLRMKIRNIFIIFLVSGFWHGANWTFIFWGGLHALFYIPVYLMGRNRMYADNVVGENSLLPTPIEILQVLLTFVLVTFSRIFFRSPTLTDSFGYINQIAFNFTYEPYVHPMGYRMLDFYILIGLFVVYEYFIRRHEREPFKFKSKIVRFLLYTAI